MAADEGSFAVIRFVMALLPFVDQTPRAYRLKGGNAYLTFSTAAGTSPESASKVNALGIESVIGTYDDTALLAAQTAKADIVINAANIDHRPSADAILAAVRGTSKLFIQAGGSAIVADCAGGEATEAVYEDDTPVHPLPLRVVRTQLRDAVLAAAREGVRSVVIAPPMIYGRGLGLNPNSIQIPRMIAVARKHGIAKYVGNGANKWSTCHIEDLADLYLLAIERALGGAYYYAENGEYSMLEICQSISRMLGYNGKTASMTLEEAVVEYGEVPANYSFGSNSRVRAVRARAELGWSPSRPSLLDELERGCYAQKP
jgi:nucleoside-diphosphate-sugar epimerase